MVVERLHEVAGEQGVNDGAVADALLESEVNEQDDNARARHNHSVVERRVRRDAHAQAVPRCEADVGKNREVHAKGEHQKAQCDLDPLRDDA